MTLGEHPDKVDRRFLLRLDASLDSPPDVGRFRDVAHLVGVDRTNLFGFSQTPVDKTLALWENGDRTL
jgi:hypothetical protein